MLRTPEKLIGSGLTALACGPGMGTSHEARVLLEKACALDLPLVLDADALNLVAAEGELHVALATRNPSVAPTVLTPHPAEASCSTATWPSFRPTASAPRSNCPLDSTHWSRSRAAALSWPRLKTHGSSTPAAIRDWLQRAAAMCSPA